MGKQKLKKITKKKITKKKKKGTLVIVESKAKARTIGKYLGSGYTVIACMGHVIDLPKSEIGVDVENGFQPRYITVRGKGKILQELKRLSKRLDSVLLAADPDREGEAISWHLRDALVKNGATDIRRISFNEVTKSAVLEAIKQQKEINGDMVQAQQARRILDRLVGYMISPILWQNVRRGLSAGRVQSVALMIVCDREEGVLAFTPSEYWTIDATVKAQRGPEFTVSLTHYGDEKIEIGSEADARRISAELAAEKFIVASVEKSRKRAMPPAPLTTSKMQQMAASKLRFSVKKTMFIAQQLYEGMDVGEEVPAGLITYLRTDSRRVADVARQEAHKYIEDNFSAEYVQTEPPKYKAKAGVQDAHEAIRPTSVMRQPDVIKEHLSGDQYELYRLIWNVFLASQMKPAEYENTAVTVRAGKGSLRANGRKLVFDGFKRVLKEKENLGQKIPRLSEGQEVEQIEMLPEQHFTQPPPRYSEATLVKALEENGIGRPSTYSPIINTIQARGYVERNPEGRLQPTELGKLVITLLKKNFPAIMDVGFTASMEGNLDRVEEGGQNMLSLLETFYESFEKEVKAAGINMAAQSRELTGETDELCPNCSKQLAVKWSRAGKFLACPGYPECQFTKSFTVDGEPESEFWEDRICDKCGGRLKIKFGRFGRFLACEKYPDCKFTASMPIEVKCPEKECDGDVVSCRSKRGRPFFGCSKYPDCTFMSWSRPVQVDCPACKGLIMVQKSSRKKGQYLMCPDKECAHEMSVESPKQDDEELGEEEQLVSDE
jgi:DNA topoisomerase-1